MHIQHLDFGDRAQHLDRQPVPFSFPFDPPHPVMPMMHARLTARSVRSV